jgi:nitrate reductase gamma subunit
MEAQNLKEDTRDIINHAGDYLDTFYKLSVLKATKKASTIASGVVNSILIFFTFFCIILFASVAAAWWLGDVLESPALGFLSVAGFYLLVGLILLLLRKKVIAPFIRNSLIKNIYEEKDNVIRGS